MLILSRYQGESITIGDIVITVVEFRGAKRVVLGIDAPKNVNIARSELPPRVEPTDTLPGHDPDTGGEG